MVTLFSNSVSSSIDTIILHTRNSDSKLTLNESEPAGRYGTIGTTDPNIVGMDIGPEAPRGVAAAHEHETIFGRSKNAIKG